MSTKAKRNTKAGATPVAPSTTGEAASLYRVQCLINQQWQNLHYGRGEAVFTDEGAAVSFAGQAAESMRRSCRVIDHTGKPVEWRFVSVYQRAAVSCG